MFVLHNVSYLNLMSSILFNTKSLFCVPINQYLQDKCLTVQRYEIPYRRPNKEYLPNN